MKIAHNKVGWSNTQDWTDAQLRTKGMGLKQAANAAGLRITLGFEFVYLNEAQTQYRDAREIIGQRLMTR